MIVLGDWGTSRLRLFLQNGEAIVDRADAPGIGKLEATPLETLRAAIAPWIVEHGELDVLMCGMVGSRNGLVEVPYAPCPIDAVGWASGSFRIAVEGINIEIAPGLSCVSPAGSSDVMRGEETQIFGALHRDSARTRGRHLFVLPGTHSKWAMVDDGVVTAFQTFPTGELFALLRDHSTLTRAGDRDDDREAGFARGLERAGGTTGLLALLFEARSGQLIEGHSRGWALGLLSGLLIGREIADALAIFGAVDDVVMIGDPTLTSHYRGAFAARGIIAADLDGDACAIAGLKMLSQGTR